MFSFWLNVLLSGYYGEQMCGGSLILFSFFWGGRGKEGSFGKSRRAEASKHSKHGKSTLIFAAFNGWSIYLYTLNYTHMYPM